MNETTSQRAEKRSEPAQGQAERLPTVTPPADIFETAEAVVVYLDMPGAARESVDVSLDDDVLTVSARSRHDVPTGYALARAEYGEVAFERSFSIGESIDGEHIVAELKDGVLRLSLPKAARSRARRIPIAGA
jgi:HSP20 family molecular chaperone IbpA